MRIHGRPTRAVWLAVVLVLGAGSLVAQQTAPPAQFSTATLDAYEHGDVQGVRTRLLSQALFARVSDLRRVAPGWIAAAGKDAESRRQLVVATYALELVNTHADAAFPLPLSPYDVVEWGCTLLRDGLRTPAERVWYLASIAVLERANMAPLAAAQSDAQVVSGTGGASFGPGAGVGLGAIRPLTARFAAHMDHARQRFPDEPRWVLAKAIGEEQRFWPQRRDRKMLPISAPQLDDLQRAFKPTFALAAVAPEAHLRWGYLEWRRGRTDAALGELAKVSTPDDRTLRYWLYLFRGQVLEETNHLDDAIASYRAATEAVPQAQAGTLALASALATAHRPNDAATLTVRLMAPGPAPIDPWLYYSVPELRFWPERLAQLRGAFTP